MATKKSSSRSPKKINSTKNIEESFKKSIDPLAEELSKLTVKVDYLQNKSDNLTTNVFRLQDKVSEVNNKVDQKSSGEDKPSGKVSLIQFLTGLSIAIGILVSLSVFVGNTINNNINSGPNQDKTVAETQQIEIETLKTQVELQQMLDNLAAERAKGGDAYEEQLNEMLPQLQATVNRLNELNNLSSNDTAVENLYKSLLIGIFGTTVFFFMHTFSITWQWLTSSLRNIFYSSRPDWKDKVKAKRYENIQKIITMIDPLISNLPPVIILIIEIYIFTSLSVPLFNSISTSIGVNIEFSPILEKLWRLDLRSAVEMLRFALFGQ